MSKPGFYVFTGDWFKKTRTITCEARGAWFDLLCLMNERKPRGIITLTIDQYAKIFMVSAHTAFSILLQLQNERVGEISPELESVISRGLSTGANAGANAGAKCDMSRLVTVMSRRMMREEKIKENARLRQVIHRKKQMSQKNTPLSSEEPILYISYSNHKNDYSCAKGFARFWALYPKKKSKGDAEKVWRQLNPDRELSERITDALNRACSSKDWQKEGGQFIPYPARWLRAKGWEDEGVVFSQTKKSDQGSKAPEPRPSDEEIKRGREFLREQVKKLTHKW